MSGPIDKEEPTYISVPRHVWDRTTDAGDISGHVEFTNSMRLAEKDAKEMATLHPSNSAVVCKLDTERLMRDHGDPATFMRHHGRHKHENEFSFSFLKHRIENFLSYVTNVIEVTADYIIEEFEEITGIY